MNRRQFLQLPALLPARASRQSPPNVVLILADDLGYGELGVQGARDIPTPNIDSLASAGVRFTDGYVSCPVCSPTRAGLMTGRYQQRFGHEFNPGPANEADDVFGLPLTETTLASRMKSLGYATGMFGKWHLGFRKELNPLERGFDEFFGFLGGAHSYLDSGAGGPAPILRGFTPVDEREYLTDALAREAVSFIGRRRSRPFFLYLPFNAVHNPAQATEKYLARFTAIADPRRRTFAAMLSALDDGVGQVLAALRKDGLEENTLIIFLSDNGGPTPATTAGNGPLRGYKGQTLEGGIRVPFMMQWKGRLPGGKVYSQPVISLDVTPTVVAAAGAAPPSGLDGVNLLPLLAGSNKGAPHQALFWRFGVPAAVRMGDWKLVRTGTGPWQLFNLAEDIGEANNLAASHPQQRRKLLEAFEDWNAQLAEPRWQRPRQRGAGRRRKRPL